MNDLKFEFLGYAVSPNDPYMLGIITIRLYGKLELRYKNISKKDGSGTFFAAASYSLNTDGNKEYISSFKLNDEDNAIVNQLIRNQMNKIEKQGSYVQTEIAVPASNNYNDNLPF